MFEIFLKEKYLSKSWKTWLLLFDNPWISYLSWQFFLLWDWNIFKPYSLCKIPKKNWMLGFYIKKSWDFSNFLLNLEIWSKLYIKWPYWKMIFNKYDKYLLFSIWSWLAPIMSILTDIYYNNFKAVNFYWEKSINDIPDIILETFQEFETRWIKTYLFFSEEWKHIQDGLNIITDELKDYWIYICWKPEFVDEIKIFLENKWAKNIFFEKY